jgi:hypothetical protein
MSSLKLYGSIFIGALSLLGLALYFNISAYNRAKSQNPDNAFAGLPTPENYVDFGLLEQTTPDENYEPLYPENLAALDGKEIIVRGFMTPFDQLEDLKTFMVLAFPTGCNFCAPPSANQVVLARQPDRKKAYDYIDGPIEVRGKLSLWNPDSEDPAHSRDFFLYVLENAQVQGLPDQSFIKPDQHRQ